MTPARRRHGGTGARSPQREYQDTTPPTKPPQRANTREPVLTEADVAHDCDRLAVAMGWRVERYEQPRATRIHEGLPDRRYVAGNGFRVWVELKRPGKLGKLTGAQHAWLVAELDAGGLAMACDDVAQLRELYRRWGALYGRTAASDYARQVTALVAQRGYRDGKAA